MIVTRACVDDMSFDCVQTEPEQADSMLLPCTEECAVNDDECVMLSYFDKVAFDLGVCAPGMSVKGRLREHVKFWQEVLEAPQSVIDVIKSGYVLPLKTMPPPPLVQKNQLSTIAHAEFICDSVCDLIASDCIRKVRSLPHICSPLSVVENSTGKKRLVVNLRYLNKHLCKQRFKYEDLRTARLLFECGDYLFSFDLKSGYHHVDIAEVHHTLLGFQWEGAYYVVTVLPFGLATACYMFTKLLRPLVRFWRKQGIRITLYLDQPGCSF